MSRLTNIKKEVILLENLKLKILCTFLIIANNKLLKKIEELEEENKKSKALIEFQKGFINGMKYK